MNSKSIKSLIIKIVLFIIIITCIVLAVYAYKTILNSKYTMEEENLTNYINNQYKNSIIEKSPIYGLLNYNFEEINPSNISNNILNNTNMFYNSEVETDKLDQIYKDIVGMSKSEYESNVVLLPEGNCYYHQDQLKEKNYNCDKVCSSNTESIMKEIMDKLSWDNVSDEEVKNYCKKNGVYDTNEDLSYENMFIDLNKLKSLFYDITSKDLLFGSDIINNKYYKYDVLIDKRENNIENPIKNIKNIDVLSIKGDIIESSYEAETINNTVLNGKLKSQKINDNKYVILSNEINSGLNLN